MTRTPQPSPKASRQPASQPLPDRPLLELLRCDGPLEVGDLTATLGVTATAVRQRLSRAIDSGLVVREQVAADRPQRGRPRYAYRLTAAGQQTAGDNFRDLASVLWQEIRSIREPAVRRGLLGRIGRALASRCDDEVGGETPQQRLQSVAGLLQQRAISCRVESAASPESLPVLVTHSCPYPELAEQDRGVCAAERVMLEDLVGAPVRLADCRLDGGDCCRFVVGKPAQPDSGPPGNARRAMVQQGRQTTIGPVADPRPLPPRNTPRSRS